MSDALPLPPHPNLEHYRKLAKDLQNACKSQTDEAIRNWAERWAARIAGFQGRQAVEFRTHIERVQLQFRKLRQSNESVARCTLAGAQFVLARWHGFASWPKFAKHLAALERAGSPESNFETAVDAIVNGDAETLERLLRAHPELVRARSTREHRSTLLHYVSANGVEDFRQKTPPNIVEIARILLHAGAGVNAESDAYGGGSTTLGLTATSVHPEVAGVQIPLMELLVSRGAVLDGTGGGSIVNACLHNGRGEASEWLAAHGARLDLEGAAGVGRLDLVQTFFTPDGSLIPPATPAQVTNGLAWACEFGRTAVVDFLLRRGLKVDEKLPHHGQTPLHWAAYGGHSRTVEALLERGAPVHATDDAFHGTPLEWALYQWANSPLRASRASYYETVALLVRAGAQLRAEWFTGDDRERTEAMRRLRGDAQMQAALRGEFPDK